jgi:hypothetical protein
MEKLFLVFIELYTPVVFILGAAVIYQVVRTEYGKKAAQS